MVLLILCAVTGSVFAQENRCSAPETVPVRFTYENREATAVSVAGDFNGWSPTADSMELRGSRWSITLCLSPGRFRYQFVVDQQHWIPDPKALLWEQSGFGTRNSVLVIERIVTSKPGAAYIE